ncbi:hypothetical protein H310_09689 [Aphanomyces invadans]|uniref:Uncharacterized protein n=1 Tax=Aphanomyces invadans TaxID=157072 RepID=A0A024TVI8_9STRA|nr:hypothetical protein H310_09689 [Aphanomyces invadans]ETV97352.1 hypothetical protein H310_09689 [Aphanomyces invadans]|eukprot:XP_008874060.1 hypothetical protein H310_09689 [Aphanomyces invadans]
MTMDGVGYEHTSTRFLCHVLSTVDTSAPASRRGEWGMAFGETAGARDNWRGHDPWSAKSSTSRSNVEVACDMLGTTDDSVAWFDVAHAVAASATTFCWKDETMQVACSITLDIAFVACVQVHVSSSELSRVWWYTKSASAAACAWHSAKARPLRHCAPTKWATQD